MRNLLYGAILLSVFIVNVASQTKPLEFPGEKHLKNIKQLTFGGENAEAYFSFDGKQLIFQSKRDALKCDQIFTMNSDGSNVKMVSNGEGRTTCSYFLKGNKKIVYASTHGGAKECPPNPDFSMGYVWPVYSDFDIYTSTNDGKKIKKLTNTPGYDAEATVSPNGKKIVFTSERDGDLDLYSMDVNGKNVKRLTDAVGYDGGAFFSPDNKMIVYRRSTPRTPAELARYKELLARHLVVPTVFEIWVMNADGTNKRQVTNLSGGSFAPFFTPDGKKIIFCTNFFAADPRKRNFDLALINLDGTGIERVTFNETFDGFPMFSPDGKKLVFASNRNSAKEGDTNVFIADWVD
ncbi:MAG: PD40 domain-containing protein [Pyrinomonadaceae bacterium]|nr:PD40 domain-containing protein [Acidobacteriota bacterium]MBK7932606.1 PD40 domain-containing protein [Acidobacteriota bacterium]MBP7377125.1 PD40 domain-containing protein [Pyrinomonadaceae bacterium]